MFLFITKNLKKYTKSCCSDFDHLPHRCIVAFSLKLLLSHPLFLSFLDYLILVKCFFETNYQYLKKKIKIVQTDLNEPAKTEAILFRNPQKSAKFSSPSTSSEIILIIYFKMITLII